MAALQTHGRRPRRWMSWGASVASALAVTLAIGGCATGGSASSSPPAAVCTSRAETTAQARVVAQQLNGRIGSAADTALSGFTYPLGLPNEDFIVSIGNLPHPGYSVFSPDGAYLATNVLLEGPNIVSAYPYVVNTVTHVATRIPVPTTLNVDGAYYNEWLRERSLTWVDDHTLVFFTGANTNTTIVNGSQGTRVFSYDITTHAVHALSNITAAAGGIARCGVLYYQEVTPLAPFGPEGWMRGKVFLHRYDLVTHTEIGVPITLGETFGFGGAESHFDGPGWDVSADGRRLVYQETLVSATTDRLVMTSRFISANPDGSHAARILMTAAPSVTMLIAISPTMQLVAATDGDIEALTDPGTPATPSAAMTVVGSTAAGSSAEFFSTVGTVLPAWTAGDNFFASRADPTAINGIGSTIYTYHFDGGGTGTATVASTGATYPATLTP